LAVGRLLLLLIAVFSLAACDRRKDAPLLDSRAPPALGPRFFQPEGFAWGLLPETAPAKGQKPSGPMRRYGVVSPVKRANASVLIVASYGESVEIYYETARDLVASGATVWIFDPPHSPKTGPEGLRRLVHEVIRPSADDTLVILGSGTGVADVLGAAEDGMIADGLVLMSPARHDAREQIALQRIKVGLGGLNAIGEGKWSRPTYDLSGRATLMEAWRTANPDLRPKARPWSWFAERAAITAQAEDGLKTITTPVLAFEAADLCAALPRCHALPLPAGKATPYQSADDRRGPWLTAVQGFVAERRNQPPHGL
jgi:hypothetical protein